MNTRFKDLCLDVADPSRTATFWAAVLGLSAGPRGVDAGTGDAVLTGTVDEHTLWLNRVPEPATVKHRVHLDVYTADPAALVAAGAVVVDESQPWTVLTDPEGGEFCAFRRPAAEVPDYRLFEVVVDARDPIAIATWWADRFGTAVQTAPEHAYCWLPAEAGLPWEMIFQPVPEPKRAKNRLHWDVWGDTEDLITAGARGLRRRDDEIGWDVLADPEGNEFCVFPPSN